MDELQDQLINIYTLARDHPHHLTSIYSVLNTANNTIRTYLLPLISQLTQKPDVASIVLLIVLLFISLKVLNMLYNAVMFWIRLAFRLAFWGSIVAVGLWVYTRGFDGAVADVENAVNIWKGEYDYWSQQTQKAQVVGQMQGRGGAAGRGQGNGRWF